MKWKLRTYQNNHYIATDEVIIKNTRTKSRDALDAHINSNYSNLVFVIIKDEWGHHAEHRTSEEHIRIFSPHEYNPTVRATKAVR